MKEKLGIPLLLNYAAKRFNLKLIYAQCPLLADNNKFF